jgi:branched-chain amino acid transport system substrate-binding protein
MMRRRTFISVAGSTGLVALAGCSGGDGDGDGDGGSDGSGGTDTENGATETDSGPGGGKPITIGSLHALAPPITAAAEQERRGMRLAVKRINQDGGINGRPVEAVYESTNADPKTAAEKAGRVMSAEGASMVWGGQLGASALAISKLTEEQQVPYFTIASLNSLSRADCKKSMFLLNADEVMRTNAMLPVIEERTGSGTQGWLHIFDFSWGYDVRDSMRSVLNSGDYDLELPESNVTSSPLTATDYSDVISQMSSANPDWAYIGLGGGGLLAFLKQAQQFGLQDRVDLYGPSAGQTVRKPAGDAIVGFVAHTRYTPLYDSDRNREFLSAFREEYDRTPNQFAKDTWETLHLYKAAVEQAGTTDFAEVVSALEDVEIEGPVGPVSFRACDHRVIRQLLISELVNSEEFQEPVGRIISNVDGESTMTPCEEMGCTF